MSLDSKGWIVYRVRTNNDDNAMNCVNLVVMVMVLTFSVSCRQASFPPKHMLPEEQLQSVYVALLEDGKGYRNFPADSAWHFKADSIFQAFNTSEQEFRSTVASYRSDPENWRRFYEAVINRLDEKQKQKSTQSKP
jgi:hypothetical protein